MGRASFKDEPRTGRPKEEVTSEMIEAGDREVVTNPHVTLKQLEEALNISSPAVYSILHEHLCVRKLFCRWVPHNLIEPQKDERVELCQFML